MLTLLLLSPLWTICPRRLRHYKHLDRQNCKTRLTIISREYRHIELNRLLSVLAERGSLGRWPSSRILASIRSTFYVFYLENFVVPYLELPIARTKTTTRMMPALTRCILRIVVACTSLINVPVNLSTYMFDKIYILFPVCEILANQTVCRDTPIWCGWNLFDPAFRVQYHKTYIHVAIGS